MQTFSIMERAIRPFHTRICKHPFNEGLRRGTLPRVKFQKFLLQDQLYLRDYSKALQKTASRLTRIPHKKLFHKLTDEIIDTETRLVHKYLSEFERQTFFFQAVNLPTNPLPIVSDYTKYLIETTHQSSIEEAVSCLVPCFYIYCILLGLPMRSAIQETNPYQFWLKSYSSESFVSSTRSIIQVVEELGVKPGSVEEKKMVKAFRKSTEFEIAFWDDIYQTSEVPRFYDETNAKSLLFRG